ncbi:hypothetical protein BM449_01035 [Synechococcus sp. SynAce01]|nr:hypothetical protein BM449_01035 [Synechococcus sp. SynAce01]
MTRNEAQASIRPYGETIVWYFGDRSDLPLKAHPDPGVVVIAPSDQSFIQIHEQRPLGRKHPEGGYQQGNQMAFVQVHVLRGQKPTPEG